VLLFKKRKKKKRVGLEKGKALMRKQKCFLGGLRHYKIRHSERKTHKEGKIPGRVRDPDHLSLSKGRGMKDIYRRERPKQLYVGSCCG